MNQNKQQQYAIPENAVVVGLCAGRHDMPVEQFIFPYEVDPTDFEGMKSVALDFILDFANPRVGVYSFVVYVTGLTACVAAVISACVQCEVNLTLMHYNRATGEYIPQVVLG